MSEQSRTAIREVLANVKVATRRATQKLTKGELDEMVNAISPYVEALEQAVVEAQQTTVAGPAWLGIDADTGEEYEGDQKKQVLDQWHDALEIPDGDKVISTTVGGTKGPGGRVRGDLYFYTWPSVKGVRSFWVTNRENIAKLRAIAIGAPEEEEPEEEETFEEGSDQG